jgi:AbrB family looped-hinge helix DNA binding protein
MALVKVKTKYQVTLPAAVCDQVGLTIGDMLEAKVEKGKIVLTPQALLDRGIAEGLEDIKQGRVYGPFNSADELLRSLHRNARTPAKNSKARR